MKKWRRYQQKFSPYFFVAPYYILFFIFGLFPVIFSLTLSFLKWGGMGNMTFVGLGNYIHFLFKDLFFWNTLGNTVWLLIFGSLSQHFFALPLAIVLNNKAIKGRDIFKTAYFLPFITSTVSIAIIFHYVFSYNFGLLNYLLGLFDMHRINWLGNKNFIKPAIAIVVNWRFIGWNTIIYLAGLQSIPNELYESAEIDGANFYAKHFHITIPLMIPIIFLAVTLSIIGGMQLFDIPFILTGGLSAMGGVGNGGFTSAYYIIWLLQKAGKLGRGSSVSWLLFLIVLVMMYVNRIVTNHIQGKDSYSDK